MSFHENTSQATLGSRPASGPKCPFARLLGGEARAEACPSLAERLKERTREAHVRAEKHPVQARMIKGEVTREEYAAWLVQMGHVWRAVDAGLAAVSARDARVAAMVKPYHAHAGRVAADLEFLGVGGAGRQPLAAAVRFAEMVDRAAASGPGLVGVWYVLEGSANGGRFIARALSRALGIAGPQGLTSFDPHGEAQKERWQAWRADLDAQAFDDHEQESIVAAANKAFDAVWEIMEEMGVVATRTLGKQPSTSCAG